MKLGCCGCQFVKLFFSSAVNSVLVNFYTWRMIQPRDIIVVLSAEVNCLPVAEALVKVSSVFFFRSWINICLQDLERPLIKQGPKVLWMFFFISLTLRLYLHNQGYWSRPITDGHTFAAIYWLYTLELPVSWWSWTWHLLLQWLYNRY